MDLGERGCEDVTGSVQRPMVGFGLGGVEPLGSASKELATLTNRHTEIAIRIKHIHKAPATRNITL